MKSEALKLSSIDVGDVVIFRTGAIGRIIAPSEPLPYFMRMALISGPTKARIPLPVHLKSVSSVKCWETGNWVNVE